MPLRVTLVIAVTLAAAAACGGSDSRCAADAAGSDARADGAGTASDCPCRTGDAAGPHGDAARPADTADDPAPRADTRDAVAQDDLPAAGDDSPPAEAGAGDAAGAADAGPDDAGPRDAARGELPDAAPADGVPADAARDARPDAHADGAALADAPADSAGPPDAPGDATLAPAEVEAGDTAAAADAGPPPPEPRFEATGYFRVHHDGRRYWLVTPAGRPFYSLGVNSVGPHGEVDRTAGNNPYREAVTALYPDNAAWRAEAQARLERWGFNTLGAWSDHTLFAGALPYTVILYLSGSDWLEGNIPDYFDPAFEARCAEIVAREVAPRIDDPQLVGYFLDNELRWGPDWRSPKTLLEDYLTLLPEDAPGRLVAEAYAGDDQAFLMALAVRYFMVTTQAIRAADPNHLILGIRSVSVMTPPAVPAAAGPFVDVYSVNNYVFIPGLAEAIAAGFAPVTPAGDWLRAYHDITHRPLLITEFSFRARGGACPNSYPPIYPTFADQDARAAAFTDYAEAVFARPYLVGYHWFKYVDEPPGGRFDGEDSNFGLVDIADTPWQVLTERMAAVHAHAPHRRFGPPAEDAPAP